MLKHLTVRWLHLLSSPDPLLPRGKQQASRDQGPSPMRMTTGFTLVEPLMALVVVSVLLVTTAPVMVLSVASRVRARQIELASQAARSYIDNLRSRSIDPPSTTNANISPARTAVARDFRYTTCTVAQSPPTRTATDPACVRFPVPLGNNFMPPTFTAADFTNVPANTDQGVLIDGNGDGSYRGIVDFRIQAIRTMIPGETVATPATADAVRRRGYSLIVRVYQGNSTLGQPLSVREVERAFTASTSGNTRRTRDNPLVVMRTEITGDSTRTDYTDPAVDNGIAPNLYRPSP
ncbi:MAG: hypothetical protein NZ772_04470 [Cyanobacteria bacterium]|nr:hypothetical protein [Cyanobacteriota bacterium]MDW8200667.1 hypothetical protein [Cyanobacteriota bacterium SKYGB_h_bin112]